MALWNLYSPIKTLMRVPLTAMRAEPLMAPQVRHGQLRVGVPALTAPLFLCSPSLPALDWQLPSHSGPFELRIEVQPKSHHRAHYETEGSRGAVKASAGGHPIVQVRHPLCQWLVPWHVSA